MARDVPYDLRDPYDQERWARDLSQIPGPRVLTLLREDGRMELVIGTDAYVMSVADAKTVARSIMKVARLAEQG